MVTELISEERILEKIRELADKLYAEYGDEEVVFVCTLKGAAIFSALLMLNYKGDARAEYLRAESYENKESTGEVKLTIKLKEEAVRGKDVVLLEDIVDTGKTLVFLKDYLLGMKPKSLKIVSLLDKKSRRTEEIDPDIALFDVDGFVVGCGLDYNQQYRNLPYIGIYHDEPVLEPKEDETGMRLEMRNRGNE